MEVRRSKFLKNWIANPASLVDDLEAARRNRERQIPRTLARTGRQIPAFFSTEAWIQLRYKALKRDGGRCLCCGRSAKEGAVLNVDHIKPRSRYPKLALKLSNLQVLCSKCNHGKGHTDETDWH